MNDYDARRVVEALVAGYYPTEYEIRQALFDHGHSDAPEHVEKVLLALDEVVVWAEFEPTPEEGR